MDSSFECHIIAPHRRIPLRQQQQQERHMTDITDANKKNKYVSCLCVGASEHYNKCVFLGMATQSHDVALRQCEIELWNVTKNEFHVTLRPNGNTNNTNAIVTCMKFFPSGELVLAGHNTGDMHIYAIADLRGCAAVTFAGQKSHGSGDDGNDKNKKSNGHLADVTSVGFIEHGHNIVSGGRDGCVKLWDCSTQQVIHSYFPLTINNQINDIAVVDIGKQQTLFSNKTYDNNNNNNNNNNNDNNKNNDNDHEEKKEIKSNTTDSKEKNTSGKIVVACRENGHASLIDLRCREEVADIEAYSDGHAVTCCSLYQPKSSGLLYVALGGTDGVVSLWDLRKLDSRKYILSLQRDTNAIKRLFSDPHQGLVACSQQGYVWRWQLNDHWDTAQIYTSHEWTGHDQDGIVDMCTWGDNFVFVADKSYRVLQHTI
ncbi:hypothetical protein RFI_30472 [Reticulomyxa filosa]|uniref:Uncharacterized protein n=1 Tax=Reticulomyxa filosa TaxID=46433 RepID=X6M1T2_RETFI|nr:hypothetical protein RFI_30472 [Reticulomyxa filosa]|eukprot:ETO06920.1 hypothetical protein RFI_30472 [Reticulomyxa filosa]